MFGSLSPFISFPEMLGQKAISSGSGSNEGFDVVPSRVMLELQANA